MSAGLSGPDRFRRLSDDAESAPAGAAPAREVRQLLEGVHRWITSSANGAVDRCFAVVKGERGCGQREMFETLEEVCVGSGVGVLHARSHGEHEAPPGRTGDLVRRLLHDGHLATAAGAVRVGEEVWLELCRVAAGPDRRESREPLPALSREQDRERLVDAVARAVLEAASEAPRVLILEDLGAADELALDVLRQLTRMLSGRAGRGSLPSLLTIVGVRDEDAARRAFGSLRPEVDALTLLQLETRGYSPDDVRRLSRETFREVPPPWTEDDVLVRTGGSVRHVSWLFRHARALGARRCPREPDYWKRLLELSFSMLVEQCFARLTEREARLVSVLAVLGQAVPERVAIEVASRDGDETIGVSLRDLRERGWALTTGAREDPDVSIVDAEVARVVVLGLPPREREALHRKAADVLERAARHDPRWLPLALRERSSAPETRPEDSTLRAAARYLRVLASPAAARSLLEEPLLSRPAADPEDRASWLWMHAELLRDAAEAGRAADVYRLAREATGDPQLKARSCRAIGDLAGDAGDGGGRLHAYEDGLAALGNDTRSPEYVALLCSIARGALEEERLDDARATIDRCLELIESGSRATRDERLEVSLLVREAFPDDATRARRIDRELEGRAPGTDLSGRFRTLCRLARLHELAGRREEEAACFREAMKEARRSGSRALLGEAGWLEARTAESGLKTMMQMRRCLEIFRDLGHHAAARRVTSRLLLSELELGKLSRAGRRAQSLGESWAKGGAVSPQGDAVRREAAESGMPSTDLALPPLVLVARRALLAGDHERAWKTIERALAAVSEGAGGQLFVTTNRTAARICLAAGDLARAYELNLRALGRALHDRSPEGSAEALLGFSEFFLQGGAFATAIGVARGGLALLRSAKRTLCELPLHCLLGRLAVEVGDPSEPEFERAAALAASLDMPAATCRLYLERGWERFHGGAVDEGLILAERGLQIADGYGFRRLRAELLHLIGVSRTVAREGRSGDDLLDASLDEALAEAQALRMPRLEWEVLQAMVWLHGGEDFTGAAARADEISRRVLGGLPRVLQGIKWRSRLAVVRSGGVRKSKLAACAG